MRFDSSLRDGWTETAAGWRCELPEGWMQGRSVFGGLTAAVAVALARRHVDARRRLRTVQVQLLRPTGPGPVDGEVRILREGKSITFVEVRLRQDDAETALLQLVFVAPRAGSLEVPAAPAPQMPGPDGLDDLPYIPGVMPEFLQHVIMRWADGAPPFSGGDRAQFFGYCGFRGPAGDEEGLVGLLDIWPAPTLSLLPKPVPASTVTWTAHLLEVPDEFGLFGFDYRTEVGADGFHTVLGRLYAPDGRLLAWTEQLAALFD